MEISVEPVWVMPAKGVFDVQNRRPAVPVARGERNRAELSSASTVGLLARIWWPLGHHCRRRRDAGDLKQSHKRAGAFVIPSRLPRDPHWALVPTSMAWEGRTLGEICTQLKDVRRSGGRDVVAIIKHATSDSLVLWAWQPGPGRTPAPGSNAEFGNLLKAWAESGAICPAR